MGFFSLGFFCLKGYFGFGFPLGCCLGFVSLKGFFFLLVFRGYSTLVFTTVLISSRGGFVGDRARSPDKGFFKSTKFDDCGFFLSS
jgi:hypothetical protein